MYDFRDIPFGKIDRVGQIILLYRDLFTVSWILGRYCNYKCSYCWTHGRSDTKDHRSLDVCINTIKSIKEQARERGFNSFNFSLSGGEPTLHPNYLEIVKELADDVPNCNAHGLHMTTNLSRSINFLREYADIARAFSSVSVTASYHSEYADKEKFAKKLIMLQEHDVHVTINMVMVPDWFYRDYETAKYFHSQNINVTLKPQSDPHAMYVVEGYTDDMLEILQTGMPQKDYVYEKQKKYGIREKRPKVPPIPERENIPPSMQVEFLDDEGNKWYMDQAERFNAFNFNRFEGWECSAGYRGIIIREPCGSVKRSYSCIDEPIGNIATGFKLHETVKPCISPTCVSSADSKIPKRKPGTNLPLWGIND